MTTASVSASLSDDGRQSPAAAAIARGTCRLLASLGLATVTELTLASGRRADIVAISDKGEIWIVEIKSSVADFRADEKWPEYESFADRLFFSVAPEFPTEILPESTGLMLADAYGGQLVREAPLKSLPSARRKAMTLRIARTAALRLHGSMDPEFVIERPG